jgi:integrase
VLLTELAVAALREHRSRHVARFGSASGFVFTNRSGGPLDGSRATFGLAKVLLAADLPRVRVHDLRHTTASVLLEVGIHPKVVQDLPGHSTIAVTLDTYSHVAPGLHREAVRRLDLLLGTLRRAPSQSSLNN